MRRSLTRSGLRELMTALAQSAPRGESFSVYFVGGCTAVHAGWRDSTIDADLHANRDGIFHDIQGIKERLQLNIEFARPEQFVPPLAGTESRHVFIETIGAVGFFHYDPYAQLLAKIVRGFDRDVQDAAHFLESGMVDRERFRKLVSEIPETEYARYPSLSREAIAEAVDQFLGY